MYEPWIKRPISYPLAAPEEPLDLYRWMVLSRRFEEKAGQLYGIGLIGGLRHLYFGQEAVIAGMQAGGRSR